MQLKLILIIILVGYFGLTSYAQETSDKTKISDNNCATNLGKNYMVKMGIIDSSEIDKRELIVREILKGTSFEDEKNGVFIISNLSAHRRNLVLIKRSDEIKLLTFCDISSSMMQLISFLDNIETSDQYLVSYINSILDYISSSKKTIKVNNLVDSDWILCK